MTGKNGKTHGSDAKLAPFHPDREALAWAAGVFDGEGHTSSHLSKGRHGKGLYRSPTFVVGQSGVAEHPPELLTRFQAALGGIGTIYGPMARDHPRTGLREGTKPYWAFKTGGIWKVQFAVAVLWEWLTPEKKAQARNALEMTNDDHRIRQAAKHWQERWPV